MTADGPTFQKYDYNKSWATYYTIFLPKLNYLLKEISFKYSIMDSPNSTPPTLSCVQAGQQRTVPRKCSTVPILHHTKKEKSAARRRTLFTTITIRDYDQCLGECPATQEGAPIALSWKYREQKSMSIDEYEDTRKPRRQGDELVLGAMERRKMLLSAGSSILQIMSAEHAVALKNGNAFSRRKQCKNEKRPDSYSGKRSLVSRAA